jgi:hypothetical protein
MRNKFLAVGSAFVLALASTLAAGCGAESVGVEEMPVFTDDTQIVPVDGGGLGVSAGKVETGVWKLVSVNGNPVPAPDPYLPFSDQGGQILGATLWIHGPDEYMANAFVACRTSTRSTEHFFYERAAGSDSITFHLTNLIPEYGVLASTYSMTFYPYSGNAPQNVFVFERTTWDQVECQEPV